MAKIDRLDGGELADLKARIRRLEMASPLANASITRGGLRVASTEGLTVEGSSTVSGTLNVTGVENVAGTLNIDGLLLVDGAAGLNGTLGINGDANIGAGGTLTVGGMVLDPNVSGFGGIRSTGTIYLSAPGVVTTGQITGGSLIIIGSDFSVTALPTTTNPPNLYIDGVGKVFRCI